jgi:hypothetical protein
MRRLFYLLVVLLVSLPINAVERKEIALDSIGLKVVCCTEQVHWLYDATNAITSSDPLDCDPESLRTEIVVEQGKLYINKGTEDEKSFKINSCNFCEGKVFSDSGNVEVFSFVCTDVDENTVAITYQKVSGKGMTHNIVTVPSYDNYGCLTRVTTYR